ncbi:MAG TPA: adenylyltransferase/cytidyltransferase family protein [Planctomycetota bacterium]|nr:adenylyltransferase/cytidyltransferase family protein [Planctomycetota bacterium]
MSVRVWPREELARELAALRSRKTTRVVLANGCFDVLHVGHVRYLEGARAHGDVLVVALNTDRSVHANKGPGRPVIPLAERAEIVGSLRAVDYVVSFEEETLEATLRALVPDVHAKGSDYTRENVPEAGVDRELGIEIAICGDPKDHATTELLRRGARP